MFNPKQLGIIFPDPMLHHSCSCYSKSQPQYLQLRQHVEDCSVVCQQSSVLSYFNITWGHSFNLYLLDVSLSCPEAIIKVSFAYLELLIMNLLTPVQLLDHSPISHIIEIWYIAFTPSSSATFKTAAVTFSGALFPEVFGIRIVLISGYMLFM